MLTFLVKSLSGLINGLFLLPDCCRRLRLNGCSATIDPVFVASQKREELGCCLLLQHISRIPEGGFSGPERVTSSKAEGPADLVFDAWLCSSAAGCGDPDRVPDGPGEQQRVQVLPHPSPPDSAQRPC